MMKRLISAIAGVLAFGGIAMAQPVVGTTAPAFTGVAASGETVNLSDFAGQRVILEWTNHDCPFVRKHYSSGNMQALQKKSQMDGTVWISVISSAPGEQGHVSAEQATELSTSRGATPDHVIIDESGEIGRLYKAKTTPHMFVIDKAGVLQYAGAIDSIPSANKADLAKADNYVDLAVKSLRAGEPIVTKQSQPYGCSVKYGA